MNADTYTKDYDGEFPNPGNLTQVNFRSYDQEDDLATVSAELLRRLFDDISQDLPAPQFGTWQPIETAPRHGIPILGLYEGPNGEKVCGIVRMTTRQSWILGDQGWDCFGDPYSDPTHWTPLPEPPEE